MYRVYELEMEMPKFVMYAAVEGPEAPAVSSAATLTSSDAGSAGAPGLAAGPGAGASAVAIAAARLGSVTFELRQPLRRVAAWVESRWGAAAWVGLVAAGHT
jgi:hypothetical protein